MTELPQQVRMYQAMICAMTILSYRMSPRAIDTSHAVH